VYDLLPSIDLTLSREDKCLHFIYVVRGTQSSDLIRDLYFSSLSTGSNRIFDSKQLILCVDSLRE
jgi:hypothetical protein